MPNARTVPRFDRTLEPLTHFLRFMHKIPDITIIASMLKMRGPPDIGLLTVVPDGGVVGSIPVLKVMMHAPIVRVLY